MGEENEGGTTAGRAVAKQLERRMIMEDKSVAKEHERHVMMERKSGEKALVIPVGMGKVYGASGGYKWGKRSRRVLGRVLLMATMGGICRHSLCDWQRGWWPMSGAMLCIRKR